MIERFRDHAANERTYLAWVRTAVTVMGFGLLVERLGGGSAAAGLSFAAAGLVVTAMLLIAAASLRFLVIRRRIARGVPEAPPGLVLDLLLAGALAFLLGAVAFYGLQFAA
ncbi:MAG TPA: DUF202 domain-containing protein [Rhodospirillales bacterium]|nr:DUF202 domain-containing protein [Rhodospirillales bacterium]